jgi:hypothetical protein
MKSTAVSNETPYSPVASCQSFRRTSSFHLHGTFNPEDGSSKFLYTSVTEDCAVLKPRKQELLRCVGCRDVEFNRLCVASIRFPSAHAKVKASLVRINQFECKVVLISRCSTIQRHSDVDSHRPSRNNINDSTKLSLW